MDATQRTGYTGSGNQAQINMAEIYLKGTALLFDIQLQAARNLLKIQMQTATMLGAPDYSHLLHVADERATQLFSMGTDQVVKSARKANETIVEMQRQIGRVVEQQAELASEQMRTGIEEIGRRTEEGLQQVREMAQKSGEELERTGQAMKQEATGKGRAEESKPGFEQSVILEKDQRTEPARQRRPS